MSGTNRKILILGSGTIAKCLSIALLNQGSYVDLVDMEPCTGHGYAHVILDQATKEALGSLNLLESVSHAARTAAGLEIFEYHATKWNLRHELGVESTAFERLLKSATLISGVHYLHKLAIEAILQDAEGVEVCFKNQTRKRYDLVIGADGVGQALRSMYFPKAPPSLDVAQTVWHATGSRLRNCDQNAYWSGPGFGLTICPRSNDEMTISVFKNQDSFNEANSQSFAEIMRDPVKLTAIPELNGLFSQIEEYSGRAFHSVTAACTNLTWVEGHVILVGESALSSKMPARVNTTLQRITLALELAKIVTDSNSVPESLLKFKEAQPKNSLDKLIRSNIAVVEDIQNAEVHTANSLMQHVWLALATVM